MALYLPLSARESSSTACVGRFLLPDSNHLAIASDKGIILKSISFDPKLVRQDAIIKICRPLRNVVQLISITSSTADCAEPQPVDILAVHIRDCDGEGQSQESVLFERYDFETKNFVSMGCFQCPESNRGRVNATTVAVLAINLPGYGTLAFSNSESGRIYLVNPLNPAVVSTFYISKGGKNYMYPYLVSPDTMAVVQETGYKHIIHYIKLAPKRRESNGSALAWSFRVTKTDQTPRYPIKCIAPLSETKHFILDEKGYLTLVDKGDFKPQFSRSLLQSGQKVSSCETLMSGNGTIILLNALEAVKIDVEFTISSIAVEELLPKMSQVMLSGLEYTRICPDSHGNRRLVKLTYDHLAQTIVQLLLWPQLPKVYNARLVSHDFDEATGSTFWSSLSSPKAPEFSLVMTRRSLRLDFELLMPCLSNRLLGVWTISESPPTFLVTTSAESSAFSFTSNDQLEVIDVPWIKSDAPTLAASKYLQVTKNSILYRGGTILWHEMDDVVTSAADDECAIIANSTSVHVVINGVKALDINYHTLVLDVACCNEFTAVLTLDHLYVYYRAELRYSRPHLALGARVELFPDGEAFVGSLNGTVSIYPSNQSVKAMESSICYMRVLPMRNQVMVCTTSDTAFLVSKSLEVDETTLKGCEAAALFGVNERLVLVQNGQLGVVSTDSDSGFIKCILQLPRVPAPAKCISVTRTALYTWHSNAIYCTSLRSPYLTREYPAPQCFEDSVFMIDDRTLLSFGISETASTSNNNDAARPEVQQSQRSLILNLFSLRDSAKGLSSADLLQTIVVTSLQITYHAPKLKIICPTRFIIYTSMESVPFEYDQTYSRIVQIGPAEQNFQHLDLEQWIYDEKIDNIWVVRPTGNFGSISGESYLNSSNPHYPVSTFSTSIFSTMEYRRVAGSLYLGKKKLEAPVTRFAITTVSTRGLSVGTIIFIDIEDDSYKVGRRAGVELGERGFDLIAPNKEFIKSLLLKSDEEDLCYLEALVPDVVIGSLDDSISYVALIDDESLLSSLQSLQCELSAALAGANTVAESSPTITAPNYIDGSLLIEGLCEPALRELFWRNGINPQKLARSLQLILR